MKSEEIFRFTLHASPFTQEGGKMNELLEKEQVLSIVPQNFNISNKGKIIDIQDRSFSLEVFHEPKGIEPKKLMEFYSQTNNGMLYFSSSAIEIKGNILKVLMPIKHRFLQRRTFTRIKFTQDMSFDLNGKIYKITSVNLSAGGMKLKTDESLDINSEYNLCIKLLDENYVKCKYQPIKIEKNENGSYTLSGRFKNLGNADKMKLIQFCMRKNIENANR